MSYGLQYFCTCYTDFIPRWNRFVAHVRPSNEQHLLLLAFYVRMPNALSAIQFIHTALYVQNFGEFLTVYSRRVFRQIGNIFSMRQRTLGDSIIWNIDAWEYVECRNANDIGNDCAVCTISVFDNDSFYLQQINFNKQTNISQKRYLFVPLRMVNIWRGSC